MLIELTGCTGSGKSTIADKLKERLSVLDIETLSSVELVTKSMGLRKIGSPTLQNIVIDIAAFPRFILSLKRYFKFYVFAFKILFRKPDSFIGALNRVRSVIRKIGVNELIKAKKRNGQIIIADEGTVHSAHNIFVYADFPILLEDIYTFARLVPLPDIIVCVNSSAEVILKRTLARKDPPGRFEPKKNMEKYIERALKTFEELYLVDTIRQRLLTVNISDNSAPELNGCIDKIVGFILRK